MDIKTIVFVLYPGLTPLDLVGPLQVLSGLGGAGYEVVVAAENLEPVETDTALRLAASHTFDQVPQPYTVVVPGGLTPTVRAMTNQVLLDYLRTAAKTAQTMASVCTGSLILGAAGLLEGRRATTHWSFLDQLSAFGATPERARWIEDGPLLTAAGVSAGIDMALHLAARYAGEDIARAIEFGIEYDPEPPFGPLDWDKAPVELFAAARDHALREGLAQAPELLARLTAPSS